MPGASHEQVTAYVGFRKKDVENVRALADRVAPHIERILDRFYAAIRADAATRSVLGGDPDRLEALKCSLRTWLNELFRGRYDAAYWRQRKRIGRTHVDVGLPPRYMVAAMEILREELTAAVGDPGDAELPSRLRSLSKLLSIELAMMLDSYQELSSENIRQNERAVVRERLTRAEHLAQIGQLAASLAHEIKNPLAGISGAIQVMRDAMAPDDPHRPIVGEILRQIDRLDGTVKDLLVYARPKPPQFHAIDLNRVIDRVLTVVRREPALQRVRLEYTQRDLPLVDADEIQLEQLLINLLLNAADASTAGGEVCLTTGQDARSIFLTVRDAGHGMDPAVLERAFEPFFTTKSKGTGLGLPICQKIVEVHRGQIDVDSEVGRGTTVTVRLPRKAEESRKDTGE